VPNNITNRDETMNDASMISARQKKTYPRRNGKYMPGENDEN